MMQTSSVQISFHTPEISSHTPEPSSHTPERSSHTPEPSSHTPEPSSQRVSCSVDMRERGLCEELKKLNMEFVCERLDIGDIVFKKGYDILLVIERKTTADLAASICDGRNREQKARIIGSGIPRDRIMYLIEGTYSSVSNLPQATLIGSVINTLLRDGIHVYRTMSVKETAYFISLLCNKLNKDLSTFWPIMSEPSAVESYCNTLTKPILKKSKRENMTPHIWFVTQLCLVPQLSDKMATEIVKLYPNMACLMNEYNTKELGKRKLLLAEITYPLTTGKTRRIGEKISERVYNILYGIPSEE